MGQLKGAASITAAIGSTGSGKSFWVKRALERAAPGRLLIWDPQDEYAAGAGVDALNLPGLTVYTDRLALIEAVVKAPEFRAVYRPGDAISAYPARFDWFCKLAYALGDLSMVIEELADVTEPSRAPDSWSVITRKGRHKRLKVVAMSQRPASVDKDFFGNCTLIHCGRLTYGPDQKVMAAALRLREAGLAEADLGDLPDRAFFERNLLTGEFRRQDAA